jgi:hypothetical protein
MPQSASGVHGTQQMVCRLMLYPDDGYLVENGLAAAFEALTCLHCVII